MSTTRETRTVVEAARMLGLSAASAYRAVERGEIPSIRIGGRILVPCTGLVTLIGGRGSGQSIEQGPPESSDETDGLLVSRQSTLLSQAPQVRRAPDDPLR